MANEIAIKRGIKLGELNAEADHELLEACFVDTGQLDELLEIQSPKSVVVGRTGSGKSALLHMVRRKAEHSVYLDPNNISIRFLEHSTIVSFFNELGVRLELFYKLLWRHILTTELLKLRYDLSDRIKTDGILQRIYQLVKSDSTKKRALDYFTEWGNKFWLDTDEHLRELTNKFTNDVKSAISAKFKGVEISTGWAKSLSKEERIEIRSLANRIVSEIQIRKLDEVIDLLEHRVFEDAQKKYYVLIDQLDENWAETDTRHRFIRALIEEIKYFRNIQQVKIVASLRTDLLAIIFDKTRDSGFQEEKYEAYLSPIVWSEGDLTQVLASRVNEVFRRQYTKDDVQIADIFPGPKKHTQELPLHYILNRTLLRPRDAIQFANECFSVAQLRQRVSWNTILAAEAIYSKKRLNSLIEEWGDYYPALETSIEVLRRLSGSFTRSSISEARIEAISCDLFDMSSNDPCVRVARELTEAKSKTTIADMLSNLLICFYQIGAIGVKISSSEPMIWSYKDQPRVTGSEVKRANQIQVHRMLFNALEIRV